MRPQKFENYKALLSCFMSAIMGHPVLTGCSYPGLKYEKGNCGVSIVRSGEAMEKALQECCRSMRIGKILVDSDSETHEAHVVFAKFPDDIAQRKVLLLYPIMR